jgi:hypothetical protein
MTRRTLLQRISIVSNRKHPAALRTAPWDEVEGSKFSPPDLVSFMASIPHLLHISIALNTHRRCRRVCPGEPGR